MADQETKTESITIKKLVNQIKSCTFLPYMKESDWNNDVLTDIEKFVGTNQKLLCLYYDDDVLKATSYIPSSQNDSIMWFLKNDEDENICLDDKQFLKSISFGKLDTEVEKSMFNMMDSLYSPFIFSWSERERDQFLEQYRVVIQELCSLRYKCIGLPSIYILPTIKDNCISEEALKVLENVMNVYITEIQVCLMDNGRVPSRCEYMMEHIMDELDYWKNKLRNLHFVSHLVNSKSISDLQIILKQNQSILIQQFNKILDEIKDAKTEADSNLVYLEILRDSCLKMYDVSSPDQIISILPNMYLKFFFIFEESPYYNKWSDISRLFDYLGNQIVYVCRKTIKLNELFNGNPESVLNKLDLSMEVCENYIRTYTETINIYNEKSYKELTVQTKDVYLFLERCKDVKYICKAIIIFKRFKNGVKELCEILEQLLTDALSVTCNAEDAINVFKSLHYFSAWPDLKNHFQNKTNEVYNMVVNEISSALHFYTDNEYQIPLFMPAYSGICMLSMIEYKRITYLKTILNEHPRLLSCSNESSFNVMYKRYTDRYKYEVTKIFKLWLYQISVNSKNIEKQLERYLIYANQNYNYWNLSTNFDCDLLNLINETENWSLMKFNIPLNPKTIVLNAPKIKNLHRNVTKIVNDYNYLISGLSEDEMILFSEEIAICNKSTLPMVHKYKWSELEFDNYLIEPYFILDSIENCFNKYKYCTMEIIEACEKITQFPLFKVKEVRVLKLQALKKCIEIYKSKMIKSIWNYYNEVIKYVAVIYNMLSDHIHKVIKYWTLFVEKIDSLICEALTLNIRCSLENFLDLSAGDGYGLIPFILIDISIINKKIVLSSSYTELLAFSVNFMQDLLLTIAILPRLSHVFKLSESDSKCYKEIISHDSICNQLHKKNILITIRALRCLKNFMHTFKKYENIWTVNKEVFMNKYKALSPSSDEFNIDMDQYKMFKEEVSNLIPVSQVSHYLVRTNMLIDAIVEHCETWYLNFSKLLHQLTIDHIENINQYIKTYSDRLFKSPLNLTEAIHFIEFHNKISKDYELKENEFSAISINIKILERQKIQTADLLIADYQKLLRAWKKYKNIIEDAAIMSKIKYNHFKNAKEEPK
ncbi:dynein axonemal heavy chain 2-like isoform X2 [Daktulosphaira vitifoliae]|uniref:dynein axonemal heavy chain 2-like isoform X2 n=1 Tax=Daktulosphaira vitifoliae TaxID=58002 RepID=UPI0021A99CF9|nr:dynein axonemal heavy chain 2-like isoform X2 [Daktulosphaira vitifoliae]